MKYFLRILLITTTAAAVFIACHKENEKAQWDVELLAPLVKTSLTAANIFPDSLTSTAPDGAMSLVYDKNIYSTPADSVFKMQDTTIATLMRDTLGVAFVLTPVIPISPQTTFFDFAIKGVELNEVIVKKGYIRLSIVNHLPVKVDYLMRLTKAKLNGQIFRYTKTMDAAQSHSVTRFDTTFDMTNYVIDLTGNNGLQYNHIDFDLQGTVEDSCNVNVYDTVMDVKTVFEKFVPIYAKGYLGQVLVKDSAVNNINIAKHITSGSLSLADASIVMSLRNYAGVDAQAKVSDMVSENDNNGNITLTCPSFIGHTINMNRATESGPPISKPNATETDIIINNGNSNVVQFLSNLPNKVTYNIQFNLNPLGDVSGHNDFIYTDSIFTAHLKVNIPYKFALNQLTFVDTQTVNIKSSATFDAIGPSTLTLIADNGFPIIMDLQLITLDKNNHATDALLVPGVIAAANVDANFRANGKQRTTITIPVDAARKSNILNATHLIFRARATTPFYPTPLQIYSDYSLDIKLIGDMTYTVGK